MNTDCKNTVRRTRSPSTVGLLCRSTSLPTSLLTFPSLPPSLLAFPSLPACLAYLRFCFFFDRDRGGSRAARMLPDPAYQPRLAWGRDGGLLSHARMHGREGRLHGGLGCWFAFSLARVQGSLLYVCIVHIVCIILCLFISISSWRSSSRCVGCEGGLLHVVLCGGKLGLLAREGSQRC